MIPAGHHSNAFT